MSRSLIIASLLFSLFIIFFIIFLLKKQRTNIKYSLIWLVLFFLLFIVTLVPGLLTWFTHLLGFKTASNMVFSLIMVVLVVITITLTVIVSQQDKKIRLLIQEISMLKSGDKSDTRR